MHDVTIVIPVYKLFDYRLRNLSFILKTISKLPVKVILVEQTSVDYYMKNTRDIISSIPSILHVNYTSIFEQFHKSWLCNEITSTIETEFIWFIDCDFYCNYEKVLTSTYNHYDFYQPYTICKDLNEYQTQQVTQTGTICESYFNKNSSSDRVIDVLGSLSFICKKTSLQNLGGFDENYIGWGLEDIDISMRILTSKHNIGKSKDTMAVHLWHPITRTDRNAGVKNLKTFKSKGYSTKRVKQLHKEMFKTLKHN